MDGDEEREEELSALTAIFPEIEISAADKYSFTLEIPVTPAQPLRCRFSLDGSTAESDVGEHTIAHLPSLQLHMTFPTGYPAETALVVRLSTSPPWISASKLSALEMQAKDTWEQYGRSQMAYDYIDSLQQAAERGFDLAIKNTLTLLPTFKDAILSFDRKAQKETFDASTFTCGICLDPKKGRHCHTMHKCGHVFCKDCLQSAYEGAITGGDVSSVKCLELDCGVERDAVTKRATRAAPTLGPDELAEIPILPATVLRYVKLKRKKRFESFPSTIYCPRKWCQGVARDKKYSRKAIENMTAADLEPENILAEADAEPTNLRNDEERLRICEDCELAFCRVCLATWHGEYVRQCWPRTADELTEDELATRSYLIKNTSPCPTCSFAIQKSMGCNHITCFNCRGHFCYLCSAWLDPSNPYEHFNKPGSSCHQRLWDMEGGDNGDGNVSFTLWVRLKIDCLCNGESSSKASAAQRSKLPSCRKRQRPKLCRLRHGHEYPPQTPSSELTIHIAAGHR
jgi:E3 ubiquitin-protein ligase RNF14